MQRVTGRFQATTTLGEEVRAFVPNALPPADPALDPASWSRAHRDAELALARLAGVAGLVPSVDWLLYAAVRKEALLTSQIEGTQATLVDLFDQEAGFDLDNADDVEEVSNYLRAYRHVQQQMRSPTGLPLSARLLCDAHRLLLDGARGTGKQPGALRRSQNWIGGSRPGNAAFVPPPATEVPRLLAELERFIHHDGDDLLPPLVRIALVHAQFETIHPFLDGNGRLGRLLIAALLEQWRLLPQPLLYVSGALKREQDRYYRLLSAIRTEGDWEAWIDFFLRAVERAAVDAERSVIAIAELVTHDRRRLLEAPSTGLATYRLFEMLPTMPRFTIEQARQRLGSSFPTASAAVRTLEAIGLIGEMTGQRTGRVYSYQAYVDLLSR